LQRSDAAIAAHLVERMPPKALARILASSPPNRAAAWMAKLLAMDPPLGIPRLADALREMPEERREILLMYLHAKQRRPLEAELIRPIAKRWEAMGLVDVVETLSRHPPAVVAEALLCMSARRQVMVLRHLEARAAAAALTALAANHPRHAGELLTALGERVWVRDSDGRRRQVLYAARGAVVLEHLDLADPRTRALLQHVDPDVLRDFLGRAGSRCRRRIAELLGMRPVGFKPAAYPIVRVRGQRRSRRLSSAMRWVRIRETVETGSGPQPLRIDLLELDPTRVRFRVCRAITDERLIPIAEAKRLFGDAGRGGERPAPEVFRRLGIVRLAEEVGRAGAIAGINGNFYFDYGHYLDAHDLGIELLRVPGLYFGDVIGWFVEDGVEVSPPIFNRAALVVTDDGRLHIRRVFMTHVELPNGRSLTWEAVNPQRDAERCAGGTLLYNGLAGFTTPRDPTRVDLAIARYRIEGVYEGGGAPMPLLGFVLSIPRERAAEWLAGVEVGDRVTIGHNFPPELGRVQQAMACGPLLVRDGQVDFDPEFEDFGEKDTSVVPFSLTRAADTFHTARSFVMLTQSRVVLGTVSGTALGSGPPRVSRGMTFGELAQLCLDLGAEQAIGLDGGGSSSLVARIGGIPRVLNVPTGGADVLEGEERFINTYWLVFER
jgi:hypothetical protein